VKGKVRSTAISRIRRLCAWTWQRLRSAAR